MKKQTHTKVTKDGLSHSIQSLVEICPQSQYLKKIILINGETKIVKTGGVSLTTSPNSRRQLQKELFRASLVSYIDSGAVYIGDGLST
jgi:hypothetical protein